MKKTLLLIITLLLASAAQSQALLFETFTYGIPSDWVRFNDGNTAHNPQYQEAWTTSYSYGDPAPGIVSTSWFTQSNDADRWVVTAPVLITDTGYYFMLDARSIDNAYKDGLEIRVSTTGCESRDDFGNPLLSISQCDTSFCNMMVCLDDYVGDTIWIAVIQNSYDKNLLVADNFRICRPFDPELELTRIILPDTVSPYQKLSLKGIITNKSMTPYSGELMLRWTYNNRPLNVEIIKLENLGFNESYTFHSLHAFHLDDTLNRFIATIYPSDRRDYSGNNNTRLTVKGNGEVVNIDTPNQKPQIKVYPNPARQQVNIACNSEIEQIQILDVQGRKVLCCKSGSIQLEGLTPGLYFAIIHTVDGISTAKFIKE